MSKHTGQLEIIGLIFIVIIVMASMLFYVAYKVSHPENSVKSVFVNKEVASNLLLTTLNVNVEECPHYELHELISDCANTVSRRIFCNASTSCVAANSTLNKIINQTLYELGKDYYLSSSTPQISSSNACQGQEKVQVQQNIPLLLGYGSANITLDLCDS